MKSNRSKRGDLPAHDLRTRMVQAIARHSMFHAGDRIGVAVSGGADSVALLRLLDDLRGSLGINLAVLHFNHQLRGVESDRDEQFVASLAAELGCELFSGREDVAAAARAHGWNLEDAGRRLRYDFFSSVADAGYVARVAVAHTADDQAETVLARIVRGTGPAGLAAIYPVNGCVVRPLLEIRRHELRADLTRRGQAWREDSSNQDTTRLRAKLRQQILPILEKEMQPAVVVHLGRLAQTAREQEAFWAAMITERVEALTRSEPPQGDSSVTSRRCSIRRVDLLAPLPQLTPSSEGSLALARRLVRGIVENLKGDCRQLTARHIDQVLQLATASSSGHRVELPGIIVERNFDWLCFELVSRPGDQSRMELDDGIMPRDGVGKSETRPPKRTYAHEIDYFGLGSVGGSTDVVVTEIKSRFRLKVIDWPAHPGEDITVFDRDLLHPPLVLRSWRPGDSFRPQGRRSVQKLKYFLRTHRVGLRERAGWPVLTSAGVLVWARGLPVAAEVVPRPSTRTGVVIVEEEI